MVRVVAWFCRALGFCREVVRARERSSRSGGAGLLELVLASRLCTARFLFAASRTGSCFSNWFLLLELVLARFLFAARRGETKFEFSVFVSPALAISSQFPGKPYFDSSGRGQLRSSQTNPDQPHSPLPG